MYCSSCCFPVLDKCNKSSEESKSAFGHMKDSPLDLNRVTGGGGAVSTSLYAVMMLETVSEAWSKTARSMYCS